MVVGADPDGQLEPFSEHLELPRYKAFLDASETKLMAEHFSLPDSALAAKMPEWEEVEGGVAEGRLFRWSTANPDSKYDWYVVGGRFPGFLRLKQPVQPSVWRRLFGAGPKDRVNQAPKADIQQDLLLADPPTALLFEGRRRECPITNDEAELQKWRAQFAGLFASIPDDALLTVVDMHS